MIPEKDLCLQKVGLPWILETGTHMDWKNWPPMEKGRATCLKSVPWHQFMCHDLCGIERTPNSLSRENGHILPSS